MAERLTTFLPAIKCSSCGVDIEISHLADHICAPAAETPPLPLASSPSDNHLAFLPSTRYGESPSSPSKNHDLPPLPRPPTPPSKQQDHPSSFLKPGKVSRPAPPKIDSNLANQPFLSVSATRDLAITPASNYSNPKSLSSDSPHSGTRPNLWRTNTSPLPAGPYSPLPLALEVPQKMDSPLTPFPNGTPPQHTPSPIDDKMRLKTPEFTDFNHNYGGSNPQYAPLSPRLDGGFDVVKKMDTMKPGPFRGNSAMALPGRSQSTGPPEASHHRSITAASAVSIGKHLHRPSTASSHRSQSSVSSNGRVGLPPRPNQMGMPLERSASKASRKPPPRPPRPDEIDTFIEQLQSPIPMEPINRVRTFPLRKASSDDRPEPPVPALRTRQLDSTRELGSSLHTPSDSGSSDGSGSGSDMRSVSSMSSPPTSEVSGPTSKSSSFTRAPSSTGTFLLDPEVAAPLPLGLRSDRDSRRPSATSMDRDGRRPSAAPSLDRDGSSRRPSVPMIDRTGRRPSTPMGESNHSTRPPLPPPSPNPGPPLYSRPPVPVPAPSSQNQRPSFGMSRNNVPEPLMASKNYPARDGPESPMDPALQRGMVGQNWPHEALSGPPSSMETRMGRPGPPSLRMESPRVPEIPVEKPADIPMRRPIASSKGNCRGCGEAIIGKSIKAADGRLTGRYHKQCFVCQTCHSPFATASFYVLDDHPYCAHHYHQLNGSLCQQCNVGIEGQYLETDRRMKFHPACFTCNTCRSPLRDDYFEVNGRRLCERHAYASTNQLNAGGLLGAGQRHPERRRTRLMMM